MASFVYYAVTVSDEEVFRRFGTVCQRLGKTPASAAVGFPGKTDGQRNVKVHFAQEDDGRITFHDPFPDTSLVHRIIPSFEIKFPDRGAMIAAIRLEHNEPDRAHLIKIHVESQTDAELPKVASLLQPIFPPVDYTGSLPGPTGKQLAAALAARESQVQQFQGILETLTSNLMQERALFFKEMDARVVQREDELKRFYEEQLAKLHEKTREIEDREQKLDKAETRAKRRSLLTEMLQEMRNNISKVPEAKTTLWIRGGAVAAHVVVTVALGAYAFFNLKLLSDTGIDGFSWAATSLIVKSALGFFAFLWFAGQGTRWLAQLHDRRMTMDHGMAQQSLDARRLAAAVETAFEYKEVMNENPPEVLMDRMTRGLFRESRTEDDEIESLSALLGGSLKAAGQDGSLNLELKKSGKKSKE